MSTPAPGEGEGVLALSLDVSAVPVQPVGAGRYTIDLATALLARTDVALTLWCRRDDGTRWAALGSSVGRPDRPPTVRADAPTRRPIRLAWEQARLPALLGSGSFDVHHGPHYTMPERARLPVVVTVHDLTFVDHPEWHERSKVVVFRRAIRIAAQRADAVVCVSRLTGERLEELCRPRARVFVVPHGVDHRRFRPDPSRPDPAGGVATTGITTGGATTGSGATGGAAIGEATIGSGATGSPSASDEDVLRELGVRRPYVLFVGTLEPRKAVPDLVAAFDRVAADHRDLSLVLAGRPGWGTEPVDQAIGRARFGDRIVRTGYVPDDAVPALLRKAAVAAYPALEEGFGLPALEALACGTPLVTTAGTAMAEVSLGAAVLVTPGSVPELAEGLGEALEGSATVDRRRRLGIEVAAAHTWEASAADHMSAYRWARARSGP